MKRSLPDRFTAILTLAAIQRSEVDVCLKIKSRNGFKRYGIFIIKNADLISYSAAF